jgi:transcription elongation factor Elf1
VWTSNFSKWAAAGFVSKGVERAVKVREQEIEEFCTSCGQLDSVICVRAQVMVMERENGLIVIVNGPESRAMGSCQICKQRYGAMRVP